MRRRTITLNLTRRKDGWWCKKIGGKLKYFGEAGCPESIARRELLDYIKLLEAGESTERPDSIRLPDLAERYAVVCEARVEAAEGIQRRTWKQYDSAIGEAVKIIGDVPVASLGADDFAKVSRHWREHRGAHRTNNDVQAVRTMFRWAFENGLISRTPIYGREFCKLPAAQGRMESITRRKGSGERRFTAKEIQKILGAVKGQMRAMVLLALNAGLYSVDVADLKWENIQEGMVDTVRTKTGIPRRFYLWPETIAALAQVERKSDRIFITSHGNAWNNRDHTDSIALMFRRLVKRIGVHREGVGFGSFRHTHTSAVGDHPDQAAARLVRGHIIEGIEHFYDFPSNERIKAVTDLARERLLGIAKASKPASAVESKRKHARGARKSAA